MGCDPGKQALQGQVLALHKTVIFFWFVVCRQVVATGAKKKIEGKNLN